MRATGFCCAGCGYVFRLIHDQGFETYYRFKDQITAPADTTVFETRDYGWLETAQREAEGSQGKAQPHLLLSVQGISCVGCVWLIERVFQQETGGRDIFVNAQDGSVCLRWVRGEFSAAEFARRLQAFGYLLGPAGEVPAELESRGLIKRIGLCAAFAMNVMLFSLPAYFGMGPDFEWAGLFGVLNAAFGTLSLLVGGFYFLERAVLALRARALHIDLPISLGILGAYAGSVYGWLAGEEQFVYFDFVSAFILLMLIGRWAQVAAVERNRRRLLARQPKPARVQLVQGGDIPPEKVVAGQQLRLAPGQTLPVESRLESEQALLSLASINGEAEPRLFQRGQRIPAGVRNVGRSAMDVQALEPWGDSLLARLLQPGERPGERHLLLERIVRGYLIGILGIAAVAGLAWWVVTANPLKTGAVVTAVLVVSCPCAIALAFPLADEMATIALRRRGVFVREADLWSRLARVRKIVFDKTGTLTLETPVLQNPEALELLTEAERARLLELVRDNPHPVSESLLHHLLGFGSGTASSLGSEPNDAVAEAVGSGVSAGGWSLGRAGWRDEGPATGETVFAHEGRALARFRFTDAARPDARAELFALACRGLPSFVLSGDRQEKVAALARDLGLAASHALGERSPQAKADWLDQHGAANALMLGDGANDSLAFERALCRGTPVIHRGVLERRADFYYLGRGIGGIRSLFEVDAVRRHTQRTILVFSAAYNLLAVGLAVAGKMNPLLAAALMPINSLLTLAIVGGGMRRVFRS